MGTTAYDGKSSGGERRNSGGSSRINKLGIVHQDSLEDVPEINCNNQDVSKKIFSTKTR